MTRRVVRCVSKSCVYQYGWVEQIICLTWWLVEHNQLCVSGGWVKQCVTHKVGKCRVCTRAGACLNIVCPTRLIVSTHFCKEIIM